ncbi:hypothetical protein Q9Q94_04470 [Uliginosibacterium sp. 31-16]|uniref:hypothetical protein n=1 Tax=Uliginosibacterium sp. 31-16 TaxID=3068315 RepID=UPI00273F3D96|nr:hypothetical protein [Uliginosibacterium sp. 31-16]MDP5238768.1 hypothetical protein [Uliginosibacterium sp. 31-16]
MDSLYYQPSGKLPVKTLPAFLLTAACAVPLGWLYAWLIWHIPLVYINFLITLGFGGAMAVAMMMALDHGHCRNPLLATLGGLAVGLLGWYAQWAAWLGFVLADSGLAPGWLDLLSRPHAVWDLAWRVNETGAWSLRNSSEAVSGIWLDIVWGVEALILLGLPMFGARSQATTPFSETAGLWFEKVELSRKYTWVGDVQAFVSQLESTPGLLRDMLQHAPEADASRYALASVYQCPGDPHAYFNLDNVEVSIKDGKEKTSRSTVIAAFRINAELAGKLA